MLSIVFALVIVVLCSKQQRSDIKIGYSEEIRKGWNTIYQYWPEYNNGDLPNMKSVNLDHYYQYRYKIKKNEIFYYYSLLVEHIGELKVFINGNEVYNEGDSLMNNKILKTTKIKLLSYNFREGENILSFTTHYKVEREAINPFKINITEISSKNDCENVKIERITKENKKEYLIHLKEVTCFNNIIVIGIQNYTIYSKNGEKIVPVFNYKAYGELKILTDGSKELMKRDIQIESCKVEKKRDSGMRTFIEKGLIERGVKSVKTSSTFGRNLAVSPRKAKKPNCYHDCYIYSVDDALNIRINNNIEKSIATPFIANFKYYMKQFNTYDDEYGIEIISPKRIQISVELKFNNSLYFYEQYLSIKGKYKIKVPSINEKDEIIYPDRSYYASMDIIIPHKLFGIKDFFISVNDNIFRFDSYGKLLLNSSKELHRTVEIGYTNILDNKEKYTYLFNLHVVHCPEYTVPFSLKSDNKLTNSEINVEHDDYNIYVLKQPQNDFTLQYCSPFKNFLLSIDTKGTSNLKFFIKFNKEELILNENSAREITSEDFSEVKFNYSLEYSDVKQLDDKWKEYFEGEKWPSFYLGEFPKLTSKTRYYRMIYTNFIPIFDVVNYTINLNLSGEIKFFFNGNELESESEGDKYSYIASSSIVRDGNNYIAFIVERENLLEDDLEFEVIPYADEKNCADETCEREFCGNSSEFLKAEVGSYYTTECGYGRNGYKRYDCIEEEEEAIFKLEEHCENIATTLEYSTEELIFSQNRNVYTPMLKNGEGHGYFTINEKLLDGIEFDQVTGEISGSCLKFDLELELEVTMKLIPGVKPLTKELKLICRGITL